MTPADHYREAERDVERANDRPINNDEAAFMLARAQVHATLALVGATYLAASDHTLIGCDT
jgi:hypothetical protein